MRNLSPPQPMPRSAERRWRFSLQTLFFVSFLLVSPFFAAAYAGSNFHTHDAAGAPIFLVIGAAIVGIATAVGYSLGARRGGFVGAITAGGLWLGIALIVLVSDAETITGFRYHAATAVIFTTAVCVWLGRQREREEPATSAATFDRLRLVKKAALERECRPSPADQNDRG